MDDIVLWVHVLDPVVFLSTSASSTHEKHVRMHISEKSIIEVFSKLELKQIPMFQISALYYV